MIPVYVVPKSIDTMISGFSAILTSFPGLLFHATLVRALIACPPGYSLQIKVQSTPVGVPANSWIIAIHPLKAKLRGETSAAAMLRCWLCSVSVTLVQSMDSP